MDISRRSDEELIKEFQDTGSIEAYETLVRRFKDPLMNFVYRFVGDRDLATDVVQDTMLKFYLKKDSYRSFAKFSTWIYTIAGNLAKNELKRKKRGMLLSISSNGNDDDRDMELRDNSSISPDDLADSAIKDQIIQRALLKVRPVYREVVILRDVQELSYEEISGVTGLSIGTVKSRINRGRSQLQSLLKSIHEN